MLIFGAKIQIIPIWKKKLSRNEMRLFWWFWNTVYTLDGFHMQKYYS